MSAKKYCFDKNIENCYTCMYIDEYAFNVNSEGHIPHGYDGMAACCKFNDEEKESAENREFISPFWVQCSKYKRCTERQADYLDIFDDKTQQIIPNPNDISKITENED